MLRTLSDIGKFILVGGTALAVLAPLDTARASGFSVLYSFAGSDGDLPEAGLIMDTAGNLYGTTEYGGGGCYCGTVFKLAPDGTEMALHVFGGGSDGANPTARLIKDTAGNLYGTTSAGGGNSCSGSGCGTVFKLAPDGSETVFYAFTGGKNGSNPLAGLIMDSKGVLYGTTYAGGGRGCNGYGCGIVFKLAPDGKETVLHFFTGGSDGYWPWASLIEDTGGNLYGTTGFGGNQDSGVVFKLAPDGTETVLYAFTGGSDGGEPIGGLIRDTAGNLYGTAKNGGTGCHRVGCGTVFRLAPDGTETVLHIFGGRGGRQPLAGLIKDSRGHLYSTTSGGGMYGYGTVFKLKE